MGNYPYCLLCTNPNSISCRTIHKRSSSLTPKNYDEFHLTTKSQRSSPLSFILGEKLPNFRYSHLSFDEFENLYTDFKTFLLYKYLRESQSIHPIDTLFYLKFYEIYEKHFKLRNAEMHRLHWTYDSRWRGLVEEFHYPYEAIASIGSPALKMFRNLKLKSRILITDEKVLNCLNIIKEDLEDEYNIVVELLRDLSAVFHEKMVKYGKLSTENLKNLQPEEFKRLYKWVIRVVKYIFIIPVKEIIKFLYERVIRIIAPNISKQTLEEQLYSLSEQLVFQNRFGIYEVIQSLLFHENHTNRKLLRETRFLISEYQDLSNKNRYEISSWFILDEKNYERCIEIMKNFSRKRSSIDRVKLLYEIHKEILEVLKKNYPNTEELDLKEKIGAENILPLFIYFIVKSKNHNIHQDIKFCEHFAMEALDFDYLFCIFKSALEYVTITE